jgi:hypothetical protein
MPDHLMDELDRFWDARLAGQPTDSVLGDAGLGEAVRRLHTAEDVDRAEPSFVNRLRAELFDSQASPGAASGDETEDVVAPRFIPQMETVQRHRWLAAIAAALLIVLVGGIASYYLFDRREEPRHTIGPAINAPATPSPAAEPTDATLFDVVLPAEVLPTGDGRLTGLAIIYVDPGSTGTWVESCCPGLMFEHIVAGEIAFTSKAAAQVLRADASVEEIAAGTEAMLRTGDTWIARNEVEFTASNTGTEPVQMAEWVYLHDPSANFGGHQLDGWGGPGGLDVTDQPPDFPGPIEVQLRRLVLDSGEGRYPMRTGGVRLVVSPDIETDILTVFGDGGFTAFDSQGRPTTAYTIEITPSGEAIAHPIVGVPAP